MKVAFSFKHVDAHHPIEVESAKYLAKLNRLLKSYSPDLVQLHGGFEKHPRKEEYTLSLNLSLPTGTLHATGTAAELRGTVRVAFAEIETQVKKHQARLRKDYEWKRKRPRSEFVA